MHQAANTPTQSKVTQEFLDSAFPISAKIKASENGNEKFNNICSMLYEELLQRWTPKPHQGQEAVKIILLNLNKSRFLGKPVYYSRRKDDYYTNGIFSDMPYHSIKWAVDGLQHLGVIEHRLGESGYNADKPRLSRFWPSEALLRGLNDADFPFILNTQADFEPEDPVIYRINTKETEKTKDGKIITKKKRGKPHPVSIFSKTGGMMAEPVLQYNRYIKNHELTAHLDGQTPVKLEFLEKLLGQLISGKKLLSQLELGKIKQNLKTSDNKKLSAKFAHAFKSTKHESIAKIKALSVIVDELKRTSDQSSSGITEKTIFPLSDIGVNTLSFRINAPFLQRSFADKKLTLEGRFHTPMQPDPEVIRVKYRFNGEAVTEPDFQAALPRLAYHSKGIDYREDPYTEPMGADYRETVKTAIFRAFYCSSKESALASFRKEADSEGLKVPIIQPYSCPAVRSFVKPSASYDSVFDAVEEAHPHISDYFYKGKAAELRYKESQIMGNILLRLVDLDIPAMPIHDSVIVPPKDRNTVVAIMTQEYERVMKFKPVIP
jgi:hypothetical protein